MEGDTTGVHSGVVQTCLGSAKQPIAHRKWVRRITSAAKAKHHRTSISFVAICQGDNRNPIDNVIVANRANDSGRYTNGITFACLKGKSNSFIGLSYFLSDGINREDDSGRSHSKRDCFIDSWCGTGVITGIGSSFNGVIYSKGSICWPTTDKSVGYIYSVIFLHIGW